MLSIGIDLSTNKTGVVVLESSGSKIPKLWAENLIVPKDLSGIDKYTHIVTEVIQTIDHYQPERIVMEGYSLNMKNASSVIPLVELGGLLRFMLKLDGHKWLDPRATEVKKFVLGKGVGPKDQIMMMVLHKWQHMSKDNNTADGYACAAMGLAHGGKLPGLTKEQLSVIGSLAFRNN